MRSGVKRFDEAWEFVDRDYLPVAPTTTFDSLIPIAMSSDFPIPVVDSSNTLVGEVHRSALAEALAETLVDRYRLRGQRSDERRHCRGE